MAETLIEGCNSVSDAGGGYFDGSQVSGWACLQKVFGGSLPTADATHKTEGTNAWKTPSLFFSGVVYVNGLTQPDAGLNLSAYTLFRIDYYIESWTPGNYLQLALASDDQSDARAVEVLNPSGAGTLEVSTVGLTDPTNVLMVLGVSEASGGGTTAGYTSSIGASTVHYDNIRGFASGGGGGGGQPVAKRLAGVPGAALSKGIW